MPESEASAEDGRPDRPPLGKRRRLDCIYVAASRHDARFTRICIASIRKYYPEIPIKLLLGSALSRRFTEELRRYWQVEIAECADGEYGWGFVKLEPLFGPAGEQFIVLDSDTVITGPVLDLWTVADGAFLVDDETQPEKDIRRLYYDWEKLKTVDARSVPPAFVFNSGQWFATAGMLTREDFAPWVDWDMPRRLRYPECFMPGDQGVFNHVLNAKVTRGELEVTRRKIMHWPGHGMAGFDRDAIASRRAPACIVHWAGVKAIRYSNMAGYDLLTHFEELYYSRLPFGGARRFIQSVHYTVAASARRRLIQVRLRLLRRSHRVISERAR